MSILDVDRSVEEEYFEEDFGKAPLSVTRHRKMAGLDVAMVQTYNRDFQL